VSLALACDLRLAGSSARFELSFVKVGLVPDAGATWFLPRIVGAARAAEMALLGRRVEADEAAQWGLVSAVLPDDELAGAALASARELAGLSSAVGMTKRLLLDGAGRDLPAHLAAEARAQGVAQQGADYAEARAAFREKRRPVFGGAPLADQ
jgi:2-(1,2-epoxy-1,2-dihydrophenyl)acetyl-CoA isomerase